MKSYGITKQSKSYSKVDSHIENINIRGFSIEENLLSPDECDNFIETLDEIYSLQEKSFGYENMAFINELDMARMPFLYHEVFFELITNSLALKLAERIVGNAFQLHLQNGIINRPTNEHHQTSWHRDLPYQDWTISRPLGFNAFYCLTEFTTKNGGTFLLPYSHRLDYFPSNHFVIENQLQIEAPKGSVIFFDSMIYHRAGSNHSDSARYGINNMYVSPILKQQVDISSHFEEKNLSPLQHKILGMDYRIPRDVKEFRSKRLDKLKRK